MNKFQKNFGYSIFVLGLIVVIVGYATHAIATAPSVVANAEPQVASTNPGEVELFLGLDKVGAFNHRQKLLESGKNKINLNIFDLKLSDAIDLTIKNHLLSREAKEKIEESLGRRWQAVSTLLPHIDAATYQQRTFKENLAALGFKGVDVIGPFNTFDARFHLVQKIIDLSALSNAKAGSIDVDVARYGQELANQKVILIAAMAYLDALRAQGALRAAQANLVKGRAKPASEGRVKTGHFEGICCISVLQKRRTLYGKRTQDGCRQYNRRAFGEGLEATADRPGAWYQPGNRWPLCPAPA